MPTVRDVLQGKGDQVHSIGPDASVLEAVMKMNQHKVGALIVMRGDQVAGIFTERDVLRRVVGEARDPETTRVGEVMTADVLCCEPDSDLDEVSAIMKNRRIRHVPVCGSDGRIQGMVSIGDVNAAYASNQEATIHYLHEYIYGRA
jgi:CBS domain-containing protein